MKIAVISDIHSNLEALTRTLSAIAELDVDEVYCLGDIVGYGPDPSACVDLIRKVCSVCVRGNHDEAVALDVGVSHLPKHGQQAALHNRAQLDREQIQFLASLPYVHHAHGCTFVHATPVEPESWVRFDSLSDVHIQFEYLRTDYCFIGHTHVPAIMANRLGVFRVRKGPRFIINVGSVGQPRDNSPHLSFGIFDTEHITYENKRIPYDVKTTAEKILAAGLPRRLAERLFRGE